MSLLKLFRMWSQYILFTNIICLSQWDESNVECQVGVMKVKLEYRGYRFNIFKIEYLDYKFINKEPEIVAL